MSLIYKVNILQSVILNSRLAARQDGFAGLAGQVFQNPLLLLTLEIPITTYGKE